MLSMTGPVRVIKSRSYVNKRGKTVNLLVWTPAEDGGVHELYIPDELDRASIPAAGELCSLYIEYTSYPGGRNRDDGSAFGVWEESRKLAGYGPAQEVRLPSSAVVQAA